MRHVFGLPHMNIQTKKNKLSMKKYRKRSSIDSACCRIFMMNMDENSLGPTLRKMGQVQWSVKKNGAKCGRSPEKTKDTYGILAEHLIASATQHCSQTGKTSLTRNFNPNRSS
jgi:hypothetical protein